MFHEGQEKEQEKKEGASCVISDGLSGNHCVSIFSFKQNRTEF